MRPYFSFTDIELIVLLKQGNEAAFAEIYQRYAEILTIFASSKLYNLEDARDIIHDLFVNIWEERKQLKITVDAKAWLFAVTRRRIVDKIRRNITREEYATMVQALSEAYHSKIEEQISAKELQRRIDESLEKLSPRVKEIYMLSRKADLNISEIAEKLNLSEQTVKNQLSVALKYLRQSLSLLFTGSLPLW